MIHPFKVVDDDDKTNAVKYTAEMHEALALEIAKERFPGLNFEIVANYKKY